MPYSQPSSLLVALFQCQISNQSCLGAKRRSSTCKMESVDEKHIRQLYQDKKEPGSFSGILTFQKNLEMNHNIKVSLKKLKNILANTPTYLQNALRFRKFPRRHYSIHGWGSLWQADLAEMKQSNGFKYILVIVDCFSLFLMTRPIKNKKKTQF